MSELLACFDAVLLFFLLACEALDLYQLHLQADGCVSLPIVLSSLSWLWPVVFQYCLPLIGKDLVVGNFFLVFSFLSLLDGPSHPWWPAGGRRNRHLSRPASAAVAHPPDESGVMSVWASRFCAFWGF